MKKVTSLFIVVFGLQTLFAQKLNKENVGYVFYEMPPVEMTIQEYKTFTTKHDAPNSTLNSNLLTIINENAKLSGFTKVANDGEFDLIVSLSFSDNKFGSASATSAGAGYVGVISYSSVANIKLLRKDGTTIHEKTMIIKEDFRSGTQSTTSTAIAAANNSKLQFEQEYFKLATKKSYGYLINQYCYSEELTATSCFQIKDKDYDYSGFNAAFEKLKLAISKQSTGLYLNEEIKTLVEEALQTFLEERITCEPDNKKAKYSNENIGGVDYNIAMCFLLLRDYDNALKYFRLAETQGKLLTLVLPYFIEATETIIARKANLR